MGRISSRGYEDRIQISTSLNHSAQNPLSVHGARSVCFLSLSFMFRADWQENSDAVTWSIWPLIRASALRNCSDRAPSPDHHRARACLCQITAQSSAELLFVVLCTSSLEVSAFYVNMQMSAVVQPPCWFI